MTNIEALQSLPPDMVMIDLTAISYKTATIGEILERCQKRQPETGYVIWKESADYGRNERIVVGVPGMAIYRQLTATPRD